MHRPAKVSGADLTSAAIGVNGARPNIGASRATAHVSKDDMRTPFDDAKREFAAFLASQGWPTELLWLSRDRLLGRRTTYWVFRPEELSSEAASRAFYEAARQTSSSLRLDARWQFDKRSLVFVEDYGGPSRKLNFGTIPDQLPVRPVSSRLVWMCLRILTRVLGESPWLRSIRITPRAQDRTAGANAAEQDRIGSRSRSCHRAGEQ